VIMEWHRRPLKRLVRLNPLTLPDHTPPEQPIRYVDISNVQEGRISAPEEMLFGSAPSRARRLVQNGDVILSTVRTYLRAVALVDDADRLIVSTGFAVLRPDAGLRSRFLWYFLQSEPFVADVMRHSEGVSYPAIPPERLATLKIAVPDGQQQQHIADFLDRETAKIDKLLKERTRLVELLEERLQVSIDCAMQGLRVRCGSTKLKYLLSQPPKNGVSPRITESGTIPTFSTAAMVDGRIEIDGHVKYADASPEGVREFLVHRNDVLVVRGSGSKRLVGRAGIVTAQPPEGGLDPVSWTSSERQIRCPEWDQRPRNGDARGDSLTRSSRPKPSGWYSTRARRSVPPREIWT
jgi:hypothetical protein